MFATQMRATASQESLGHSKEIVETVESSV
jgi:hypothetical protein